MNGGAGPARLTVALGGIPSPVWLLPSRFRRDARGTAPPLDVGVDEGRFGGEVGRIRRAFFAGANDIFHAAIALGEAGDS
jgi:hypothetical protein